MFPSRRRPGVASLLSAAAIGVYLLVVAGATASVADAASACTSWPLCHGPLLETTTLIAVGHRVLAALVGVLVVAAAIAALRSDVSRRVRAATVFALALYPVQIAVGALLATSAGAAPFPGTHLVVGVGIFSTLVVALAWQLEAETGTTDDDTIEQPELAPEPVDEPTDESPVPPLSDRPLGERLKVRGFAYFRLMKPRLMWLLCLVAAAGMALAAGPTLTVRTIVLTLGGGVLAIGASGTFNHVLEWEKDKRMNRTSDRPVATHQIPKRNATVFGLALAALSLGVFWQVNLLTTALGLVAILFYTVIYTLVLKPNTVQNTVIGGAAGALPALIGWAAVTGDIGAPGIALAVLIFAWTPAHFYNLALAYKDDYARGGFPMMPVVRGETTTRKHILLWLGATLVSTGALVGMTDLGWVVAAVTAAVGAVFLWAVVRLHREQTEQAAFRAFHASNAYLGLLLVTIVVDALVL
ncbi:MAG: heme o synthase [Haloarculaceae archaeon]